MTEMIERYHSDWKNNTDPKTQDYLKKRVFETIDNLFTKIIKKEFKGKILDVGCGDGSFARVCNEKGLQAAGIDICDGCDFEVDKFPYADNEFDIVFVYSVIEHIHDPANLLKETKRVLKPGGTLIIITPEWRYSHRSFYCDPTHVRPYDSKGLARLMQMYGMKKIFSGLWTVKKSHLIWKLPEDIQFLFGKILPFDGLTRYVPGFLKGRSSSLVACFSN